MIEARLPLFPLEVVLFPGSALPLHIFEERYKTLINESVSRKTEFGIHFVRETNLAGVGCSAVVRDVMKRYEDGRMDIVVRGSRRYRLHRCIRDEAPYLVGVVEFLPDPGDLPDPALSEETILLYNRLVAAVYKGKVKELPPELSTPELSFLLAQKSGIELRKRQELLETDSENIRLRLIHDHLYDIVPRMERAGEMERIVMGDGYQ